MLFENFYQIVVQFGMSAFHFFRVIKKILAYHRKKSGIVGDGIGINVGLPPFFILKTSLFTFFINPLHQISAGNDGKSNDSTGRIGFKLLNHQGNECNNTEDKSC